MLLLLKYPNQVIIVSGNWKGSIAHKSCDLAEIRIKKHENNDFKKGGRKFENKSLLKIVLFFLKTKLKVSPQENHLEPIESESSFRCRSV